MITANGYKNKFRRRRLKCEVHNHYHINNINNISNNYNSTIVQGNTGETISVSNGGMQLSEREAELVRIFRLADERKKNEAMSYFFKIEDSMKGGASSG